MLALRVLDIAAEVNGHAGLIAHGPGIVTGFDGGNITRANLTLLATIRLDAQPARAGGGLRAAHPGRRR